MDFLAPIEAQRGHLFTWSPVALGCGIGIYFALPFEPGLLTLGLAAASALVLGALFMRRPGGGAVLMLALALVLAGLALAGTRSRIVASPVLGHHYYGPIEGRIVKVDRSQSQAVRLTLDRVRLARMAPERVPERVRISLHAEQGFIEPRPGLTVILTGHLDGPAGPVEPGGFNFQRMAWFDRIGAVGYTRLPVLALAPPGNDLPIARLRARISAWVRASLPGEAGAFAAAVTTGERSALSPEALTDLRRSNLAHLLAISGLHMGLLTGFVFTATRFILSLFSGLSTRLPAHKLAAIVALGAGVFYLALSGGNVATQRAFIMVGAMFGALLFDRRALTLHSVALAALIVLILHPEVLSEAGFQMSFSATAALIAAFGYLNGGPFQRLARWARPGAALVVSSAVAGAATAPFAAAHFNQVALFGLPANLLAVPAMGLVVIPGAVLAALLAPIGLGYLGLIIMRPAILWILWVAHTFSGLDGAVRQVASPQVFVLPMIALGALFTILWHGRARWAGAGLMAFAFAAWNQASRPDLLISPSGRLVGVLSQNGRVLNSPKSERFAAGVWLENDGDAAGQEQASARMGWQGGKGTLTYTHAAGLLVHLSGRGAADRVAQNCQPGRVVITSAEASAPPGGAGGWPCMLVDKAQLSATGAVALYADRQGGWRLVSATERAGRRPWNAIESGY